MASNYRKVAFKAFDGTLLKGNLFSGGENRPCLIMTSGVGYPSHSTLKNLPMKLIDAR